jgi:hypothetical protein
MLRIWNYPICICKKFCKIFSDDLLLKENTKSYGKIKKMQRMVFIMKLSDLHM